MTEANDNLCHALRDVLVKSGADLCVLFGSRTSGRAGVAADVDLAVRFPSLPSPEARLRLINQLQAAVGAPPVDVVFLHRDTDPVLRFEIFRAPVLLLEASAGSLVEERVRALMLYEDALPFRRALRERLRRTPRPDGAHVS